jgi:hypothetical protein
MSRIPDEARRLVKERDLLRCLRCGVPSPHGEWHHRRSRRVVDTHTHCACNGVWLCGTCHRWAHAHPLLARHAGLIVSQHIRDPGSIVIETAFGVRSQDCDGFAAFLDEE